MQHSNLLEILRPGIPADRWSAGVPRPGRLTSSNLSRRGGQGVDVSLENTFRCLDTGAVVLSSNKDIAAGAELMWCCEAWKHGRVEGPVFVHGLHLGKHARIEFYCLGRGLSGAGGKRYTDYS